MNSISFSDRIDSMDAALSQVVESRKQGQAKGHVYLVIDTKTGMISTTKDKTRASSMKRVISTLHELSKETLNDENTQILQQKTIKNLRSNIDVFMDQYENKERGFFGKIIHRIVSYFNNFSNLNNETKQNFDKKITFSDKIIQQILTDFQKIVSSKNFPNVKLTITETKDDALNVNKEDTQKSLQRDDLESTNPLVETTPAGITDQGLVDDRKVTFAPDVKTTEGGKKEKSVAIDFKKIETNPTRVSKAFKGKLHRELDWLLIHQKGVDFATGSFDTVLSQLADEVESGKLSPQEAVNNFFVFLNNDILKRNEDTLEFDRETFRDLLGEYVVDGRDSRVPSSLNMFDPHLQQLIDDYNSGAWKEGEERTLTQFVLDQKTLQKVQAASNRVLNDEIFRKFLTNYFSQIASKTQHG